jgi:hypothetical protein
MTSKIKVDNINKVSDDTNIIKKCGTTTTIGSGASNPIVVDGSAVTLGRCGGTVALASGATQTGFGRTGTVDWQTGSIKTSTFTAANGEGYFADTSSGGFTMNLPAGTAGNIVSVVDYTNTFQTNALTISPNGSQKIGGVANTISLNTEGQSVTFVYVDDTEGWKNVQDSTSNVTGNPNLIATGGSVTTSGNFKIHTFTGPGTFTVCNSSSTAANNIVSYMVVAGGGGGEGGGGGAGGFREYKGPADSYTASPLNGNPGGTAVTVTAQAYPITVGAGGAGGSGSNGTPGNNSIFSTVTSNGGGGGAVQGGSAAALTGGSGGGCGQDSASGPGAGNTPPVSPPQGNNGGVGTPGPYGSSGGGGGATAVGTTGSPQPSSRSNGGNGGAGATTSITASPVAYAGGGGGGANTDSSPAPGGGCAGAGGGGAGSRDPNGCGSAASTNTGGGGGGGEWQGSGGTGGSGIVVIRYKFQ